MALVVISIDRKKLPEHTDDDFADWIRFEVGQYGDISLDNPLCGEDMSAIVREIGI